MKLTDAIQRLKRGEVVAVPTETVYGLAASLECPQAIEKIFTLKKRPENNPLIIHLSDALQIHSFVTELPEDFDRLATTFWPGALTLVLPVDPSKVPTQVRAGLPTAAFRIPSQPLTRQLIKETGPLVMPSANLSGKPSATTPSHVLEDFGKDVPVLDGGVCECGIESTVLRFHQNKWEIIRLGVLSSEAIAEVLGYDPSIAIHSEKPACPGQLFRHYAPKAKMHLKTKFLPGQIILGYTDRSYPKDCQLYRLGRDPKEVMKKLYATLRQLDQDGIDEVWVDMDIPNSGLWQTIRERLERASR